MSESASERPDQGSKYPFDLSSLFIICGAWLNQDQACGMVGLAHGGGMERAKWLTLAVALSVTCLSVASLLCGFVARKRGIIMEVWVCGCGRGRGVAHHSRVVFLEQKQSYN